MKRLFRKVVSAALSALIAVSSMSVAVPAYAEGTLPDIVLTPADVAETGGENGAPGTAGDAIGNTTAGSWVKFQVDFGEAGTGRYNAVELELAVGDNNTSETMATHVTAGAVYGAEGAVSVASFYSKDVEASGWSTYYKQSADVPGTVSLTGVTDVYLYFTELGTANVKSVRFYSTAAENTPSGDIAEIVLDATNVTPDGDGISLSDVIGGTTPYNSVKRIADFGDGGYDTVEINAHLLALDGAITVKADGQEIAVLTNGDYITEPGDYQNPDYQVYQLALSEEAKAALVGEKEVSLHFSQFGTANIKSVRIFSSAGSSGSEPEIDPEIVTLDAAIADADSWTTSNPGVKTEAGEGTLTVSGGSAVAGYADEEQTYHNKLLQFKLNAGLDGGEWPAIYVRHQAGSNVFWQSADPSCYGVVFKKDVIELQKGELKDGQGTGTILQEVPNTTVMSGVDTEIVFGAVDVEGGVRLILRVNGETVFDYTDTENPYTDPGSIAVYAFVGPVTLLAMDAESGGETPVDPNPDEVNSETAYPRAEDERAEETISYDLDGTIYYVSADVQQNGDGSKENPWNSVAYAASVVPANQDAVIYVKAGTYTETSPIVLKSGTNLIGEDKETTILKTKDGVSGIYQEYGTGNIVAGFTLDGENNTDTAVSFYRSRDSVITDLIIKNYNQAFSLSEVKNGDFYNVYVKDTYGNQAGLSGSNCKFHDMVFDCYLPDENGNSGWGIDVGTYSYAYDWELYNLSVQIPFRGGWDVGNGYKPPAFAFEICGGNIRNIDVHHCDFNNGISLVPYINKSTETSIRFHNNVVRIATGEMFAFEVAKQLTNCEIYENLIIGGSHNFSNWDGDDLNGMKVYRNIFDMVDNEQDHSHLLASLGSHYENVAFQNNTIIAHEPPAGNNKVIWVENSPNDAFVYQNNILVYDHNGEELEAGKNVLNASEAIVQNNLFWKLAAFEQGENNIVADPLFVGEGNSMEKYALTENSPARDAGIELEGFTPADGKTDLGALEYGEEPFRVGPYQEGLKPVNEFNLIGTPFDGSDLPNWRDTIESIVFFDCYTGWKDSLEKVEDESLMLHYTEYEELHQVDSYTIPAKAFTTQYVVKLTDGSYDGLAGYTGIEGISVEYRTGNPAIISTNSKGVINAVDTGTATFHVSLMDGEEELGTGSVSITTPGKVYQEKYTYHPMSEDDFWIIGLDGVISADGETVGFLQTPGEGVEYHIRVPEAGTYHLYFQYSQGLQPGSDQVFWLDEKIIHEASGLYSGGWGMNNLKDYDLGIFQMEEGEHDVKILNSNGYALNYGAVMVIPADLTGPADTYHLEQALIQFSGLKEEDFDTFRWSAFTDACEKAKECLRSEEKTQLDVERAFIWLLSNARKLFANYSYLELASIEVVDQPRLVYMEGENLDLSGMTVKVTYTDGTSFTVPYAGFEDCSFAASPSDALTTESDGETVTVSYFGCTAQTDALTVYSQSEMESLLLTPSDVDESHNLTVNDDSVVGTQPGSWMKFENVDFKDGVYNQIVLTAALGDGNPGYETRIVLDDVNNGPEIARLVNSEHGANSGWIKQDYTIPMTFTKGVHDVYLVFSNWGVMNFYDMELLHNPAVKGTSSYLESLSSTAAELSPAFDRDFLVYSMTVSSEADSIELVAAAEDKNAVTTINGEPYDSTQAQNIPLNGAVNEFVIKVTSEDGSESREYTLTVYKKAQGAKDLYVAVDGNENNSGLTPEEPLGSLFHALALADAGTTIHLAAGTYSFEEQILLKDGVSIVGAGMEDTILESKIKYTGEPLEDRIDFTSNGYLMYGENLTDVTISNLTLVNGFYNVVTEEDFVSGGHDLGYDSAHGGINIIGANRVNVHDVYFDSFNFTGMFLAEAENSNVYQNKFYNSGKSGSDECIGSLTIDNLTDCTIYDNIFRETRGGYGIKSKPRAYDYIHNARTTQMTRLQIYNNDFELRQAGGWLAGSWAAGNFSIELWNAVAQEVDIYNNRFTDGLSLVCNDEYYSEPYSYKIYNNLFLHRTMQSYTASYSIEAGFSNAEVFNNYFEYGISALGAFSGHTYKDVKIHDNVFYGQEMTSQLGYTGSGHNITLENNIIYLEEEYMQDTRYDGNGQPYEGKGAFYPFRSNGSDNQNISLLGNVLISEVAGLGAPSLTYTPNHPGFAANVKDNILFRWDVQELSDASNVSADPLFNGDDMRLAYNSPAYAKGFEPIDLTNTGIQEDAYFSPENPEYRRIFLLEENGDGADPLLSLNGRNDSLRLAVKGVTTDGYLKSGLEAVYSVEGDGIVSVASDGLVTPVGEGVAKVTASVESDGKTLTSSVWVQVSMSSGNTSSAPSEPSVGTPLPETDGQSVGKSYKSDTTVDLAVDGTYQFRITSLDGSEPVMTASNGNFRVELVSREGNDYFFKIHAQGPAGSESIISVNGETLLTATVGGASDEVISDTTHPFTVVKGGAYQFRLTADERPAFAAGSPSFRVEYAGSVGRDWFYKVYAVGEPGDGCGFYINGTRSPVAVAHIA